jgi:hypothetical protein
MVWQDPRSLGPTLDVENLALMHRITANPIIVLLLFYIRVGYYLTMIFPHLIYGHKSKLTEI